MNYLIDFDTRSVQCKHEDADVLEEYIFDNGLDNAVAVIGCADDLDLYMSERELRECAASYMGANVDISGTSIQIAHKIWGFFENHRGDIVRYTVAYGKRLIREAEKERKPTKQKAAKRKPAKAPSSNAVYEIGPNKPARMAQQISAVLEFMDSNLDEATEAEILEILEGLGGKTNPLTVLQGYVKKGFIQKV